MPQEHLLPSSRRFDSLAYAASGSLETLTDMLPWPAAVISDSGQVTHLNAAMAARSLHLNGTQERHIRTLFPEYSAALPGDPPWPEPLQVEVTRQAADGAVHERLHTVRRGAASALIVVDETRLHELELGYAQNARLASLGFLLASVSHEANGPLAAISSMVQIMESKHGVSEDVWQKGIRLIAESTRRLLLITRKLTSFVRVGESARSPFSIDSAVDDAFLHLRYDRCGTAMQVAHRRDPRAIVVGNQDQAQQVFFNLFLNAAQACDGHGTITVATTCTDGEVSVCIGDSGPGIAESQFSRVFEPFFTTKSGGDGIGLGLAICNEIMQEHKGRITIKAGPAGGSLFELHFPLAKVAGPRGASS
ncbi:MAG: ATP-binding protein [Caldimonas sp.]